MKTLRAAVIGVGNMGRHHARVLASMRDVELAAVVDSDEARAATHAASAPVFRSADELERVDLDLAVVAVPTEAHMPVTLDLVSRGVHVLVEKPLAHSIDEAERMVAAAAEAGVVLAVGHIERFNPVVRLLSRIVRSPRLLQFERLSPYTPRIKDSVVFDLMVHDLDLACVLTGDGPSRILGSGTKVFSESLDVASAILEFPGGAIATLQASRATQDKVRRIAISETDRFLTADCVRQDVSIKRETAVEFDDDQDEPLYRQANVVEIPYLDRRGEPLAMELEDFVAAIQECRPPQVDGVAGLRAVKLALAVERAATGG